VTLVKSVSKAYVSTKPVQLCTAQLWCLAGRRFSFKSNENCVRYWKIILVECLCFVCSEHYVTVLVCLKVLHLLNVNNVFACFPVVLRQKLTAHTWRSSCFLCVCLPPTFKCWIKLAFIIC